MIPVRKVNSFSTYLILFSAILIGIETYNIPNESIQATLIYLDYFVILLFTIELLIRLRIMRASVLYSKDPSNINVGEEYLITTDLEKEKAWLVFDTFILLFSFCSIFIFHFVHPEFVFLGRIIRIFRLFRLFELTMDIKSIESKIINSVPTILIFATLLSIIMYIYAVLGVTIYDHTKFETIDFTNAMTAFLSLFSFLIDGGITDGLRELRNFEAIPSWISTSYLISYIIISALVTLNVFIAVLTNQVWEQITTEQDKILEEEIEKDIDDSERVVLAEINKSQRYILKQIHDLSQRLAKKK